MRIGYLYDLQVFPPKGGNHRHVVELVQGFLGLGHSVAVVCDPTVPSVSNYDCLSADLEGFIASIDVLYVRIDARLTREWVVLNKCMGLIGNLPVVWEINSPSNETLAYSWLGGKYAESGSAKEGVLRRLRRWFHATKKIPGIYLEERHRKYLAKNVSYAICVSTALSKYATEGLGVNDVLVLPNGGPVISEQEISERRSRRQRKSFTVLYSGSAMYPWQGLDFLSGAIAIAAKEAPDMTFVLAVNQRSSSLPVSDNVIVREGLNREKILDAICAADACVAFHPEYFWSRYKFHGSPMKLFEYMACMAPSVTSNLGQMREIIRDGEDGTLCENDPRGIFRKLVFLKDNPDKAKSIGRKGWERIQSDFNWKNNVKKPYIFLNSY